MKTACLILIFLAPLLRAQTNTRPIVTPQLEQIARVALRTSATNALALGITPEAWMTDTRDTRRLKQLNDLRNQISLIEAQRQRAAEPYVARNAPVRITRGQLMDLIENQSPAQSYSIPPSFHRDLTPYDWQAEEERRQLQQQLQQSRNEAQRLQQEKTLLEMQHRR